MRFSPNEVRLNQTLENSKNLENLENSKFFGNRHHLSYSQPSLMSAITKNIKMAVMALLLKCDLQQDLNTTEFGSMALLSEHGVFSIQDLNTTKFGQIFRKLH